MDQESISLTREQGYAAMVFFLEKFWRETSSDDVASLLGSMAILSDGSPTDAGLWQVWMECCNESMHKEAYRLEIHNP
ncbi:MAG: hypothetical protein WDM70_01850 [Nitrosomonadales bacterium]